MGLFGGKNEAVSTVRVNYNGDKAEKGLKSLRNTVAGVISALALKQIFDYSVGLAKLGAEAEMVNKNFEKMALQQGRSTESMMGSLRKATMGMVSDLELQQNAMKAIISGVDFDDIVVAMEYVTKYAAATGTDVSQKMFTVMTGLARKSAMFMDDVGIQVMGAKDVVKATIDQMKEKMGQFATSEEDAAVQAKKLNAEYQNQKEILGKELLPIYTDVLQILNKMLAPTAKLLQNFIRLNKVLFTDYTRQDMAYDRILEVAGGIEDKEKRINYIFDARGKLLDEIKKTEKEIADNKAAASGTPSEKAAAEYLNKQLTASEKLTALKRNDLRLAKELAALTGKPTAGVPQKKTLTEDELKSLEAERKKTQDIIDSWDEEALKMKAEFHQKSLDERRKSLDEDREFEINIEQEKAEEILSIRGNYNTLLLENDTYAHEQKIALLEQQRDQYPMLADEINALIAAENDKFRKAEEEKDEEAAQKKLAIQQEWINSVDTINGAFMQILDARTQMQIKNLDELNLSEEEYEKRKTEIMKEAVGKRRVFARIQQAIAVADAWVKAVSISLGAASETYGGPITRALAYFSTFATMAAQIATIEAQNFQTGRIGKKKRGRQGDNIEAMIGEGETIISAPQSAAHEEDLRAIASNTANTAAGIRKMQGATIINNYYGLSTEQVLQAQTNINRRNASRRL